MSPSMLRASVLVYCVLQLACTSTGSAGLSAANVPDAGMDASLDSGADVDCGVGDCQQDGSSPDSGTTVPCKTDDDCGVGLVCGAEGLCVECREHLHCITDERTLCEVSSGQCVQCLSNADCMDADEPACSPWGSCARRCIDDAACEDAQRCETSLQLCVQCLSDVDCKDGIRRCDVSRHLCLECEQDSDCDVDEPHCIEGACSL